VGFRAHLIRVCTAGFGEHQQQEFGHAELSEDDLFDVGSWGASKTLSMCWTAWMGGAPRSSQTLSSSTATRVAAVESPGVVTCDPVCLCRADWRRRSGPGRLGNRGLQRCRPGTLWAGTGRSKRIGGVKNLADFFSG
jgi:hypothetical protein